MVVLGHGSLTLEHLDGNSRLVVGGGGEDLRLLGGNDSVSGDEFGHDAADGFDAQREWIDVEQHDVSILLTRQHTGLHGRAVRHSLVRVDASAWLLYQKPYICINFGFPVFSVTMKRR